MTVDRDPVDHAAIDAIYADAAQHWHVNTGEEMIHARRQPGRWRTLKWLASSVWLLFFFGAYLRWDGRQAVLFDIPNRQFHIFGVTVLPQDFWMLSLVLLFFAILLAVVTTIAGRVYCGYFCFQTVWTDIYTWLEERLEGPPQKRRKLDKAPWNGAKIRIKVTKHLLWLLIAVLTGISFVSWFTDVYELWADLATLRASAVIWATIALFSAGTWFLAGFMREQTCFWLCPYARIQGVMMDEDTSLPTYDLRRGEPRGRVKKGADRVELHRGDCIDCNLCLAVCPTGVDIREGQQEGCITCALCIDACNGVMDKLKRPRGLIRYSSLDENLGEPLPPLYKRPRVWVYTAILAMSFIGIIYGLSTLDALELKVLHARQPLFVLQSDGSIQNRYRLKVLNKTTEDMEVRVSATGPTGLLLVGAEQPIVARNGKVTSATVFIKVPRKNLREESEPVVFRIEATEQLEFSSERESIFIGPDS